MLSSTLVYRDSKDLRNNLIGNADKMGRVIAGTLVEPMLHDDVWRVFEIINTPFHVPKIQPDSQDDEYILILNAQNTIYASTKPERFPMLKDPASIDPRYAELLKSMPDTQSSLTAVVEPRNSANLFLLIPIQSDGIRIGTLVMSYPKSPIHRALHQADRGCRHDHIAGARRCCCRWACIGGIRWRSPCCSFPTSCAT